MLDRDSEEHRMKVGRVQWRPSDPLWVKLNVDGAFRQASQFAGGGGVVRDEEGDIIAAFSARFAVSSSLEEVSALLIGVTQAKQHGSRIWIESDAESVVLVGCLLATGGMLRYGHTGRLENDARKGLGAFSGVSISSR
ncbi:uncharacterized protein LOC121764211 [Salvia splendens]|uniref:uncharacterized protein LOC121764211 n=1 Tax=Salvia splendens TaxID=180675 RepID=UPI001C27DE28|nr:uncharacterized protein LOC121764211 [Salvia splendens]